MKNKIFLTILIVILGIASIVGGYFVVQQRQQLQEKAAPATRIYFSPQTVEETVGQNFAVNILVDTAENHLAVVRLDIDYNQNVLEVVNVEFNSQLLSQMLRSVDYTSQPGKISGSAGASPGNSVYGQAQRVATVSFKVLAEQPGGTIISFAGDTAAYSATKDEEPGDNLISQKESLTVTIAAEEVSPSPSPIVTEEPEPTLPPTQAKTTTVSLPSPTTSTSTKESSSDTTESTADSSMAETATDNSVQITPTATNTPTVEPNNEELPETANYWPTFALLATGAMMFVAALLAL